MGVCRGSHRCCMSSHPPLTALLSLAIGGVLAMYGLAFEQYMITGVAVAAGIGGAIVLGRSGKATSASESSPAFTQRTEETAAESGLSDRALKRQQRFAKKADKEARIAERKARKLNKRKAPAVVPAEEDFLAPNDESGEGFVEESQVASVFGGARVNADLIPNVDGSFGDDPDVTR